MMLTRSRRGLAALSAALVACPLAGAAELRPVPAGSMSTTGASQQASRAELNIRRGRVFDQLAALQARVGDQVTVDMPASDGRTMRLELERFNILTNDAVVEIVDGDKTRTLSSDRVQIFRGSVDGDVTHQAVIAIGPAIGVYGTLRDAAGKVVFVRSETDGPIRRPGLNPDVAAGEGGVLEAGSIGGPGVPGGSTGRPGVGPVSIDDGSFSGGFRLPEGVDVCGAGPNDGINPEWPVTPTDLGNAPSRAIPCRVVRIAIDTDVEYSQVFLPPEAVIEGDTGGGFGGGPVIVSVSEEIADAAAEYALALFGVISEVYRNELNVRIVVPYLRIWQSNEGAYPYVLEDDEADDNPDALRELFTHWDRTPSRRLIQRDLVHRLSGRDQLDYLGVAYRGILPDDEDPGQDTICGFAGYGVSAFINGFYPQPTQSYQRLNYDLLVTTHEIGHNFGTGHTHDSYEPAIDMCPDLIGIPAFDIIYGNCKDAFGATIMSYCHQCPGGFQNMRLGFNPLVKDVIWDYLDAVDARCAIVSNEVALRDDRSATLPSEPVIVDVLNNDGFQSCDQFSGRITSFNATTVWGGEVQLLEADPTSNSRPFDRLVYTPPAGFTGVDSFTYRIPEAEGFARVRVTVEEPIVSGEPIAVQDGLDIVYTDYSGVMLPDNPYASGEYQPRDKLLGYFTNSNIDGDIFGANRNSDYGLIFTGFISVPRDDIYEMVLKGDDGSRLFVAGRELIVNDGFARFSETRVPIALAAGLHRVRVDYYQSSDNASLTLGYTDANVFDGLHIFGPGELFSATPSACPIDYVNDGFLDMADIQAFLGAYGQEDPAADLAAPEGVYNFADVQSFIGLFVTGCGLE